MADAFSKKATNILPQSRLFNYKLYFNGLELSLRIAYLYKISIQELEKIRKYLIKNLKKSFIKLSDALYLSLILLIKKKDKSLYFYIDYRYLNALIKKDRYPLSFIIEILNRLTELSVFTKLNI